MPLDPQVQALIDQFTAANLPDVPALTPREARLQMDVASLMLGKAPAVGRVEDLTIPGPCGSLRARLTTPVETTTRSSPLPCLVFFHGGGFVVGGLFSHDNLCRAIASASGVAVISVDYRLAPEHPFPAAVDDAFAATTWVAECAASLGLDPSRLAVGGDSAGGNLATVVARRARDQGGPKVAYQLLIYPATDADFDRPSYLENAEGYLLTRAAMQWYWNHYVPNLRDRVNPDASPLRAEDLSGLPPALVVTAGFDPLRDEGEAYAQKLADAGVHVRHVKYPGMIHGFLRRYAFLDQGKVALAEIGDALRAALGV
jgi:acetyl esterase